MELANSIHRERERKSVKAMALGESWTGKEGGRDVRLAVSVRKSVDLL